MPEHTIAENLQRLIDAKTAIGNAITAKGGTVGANDGLEEFVADIATIPSGGVEFSNYPYNNFTLKENSRNLNVDIPYGVLTIGASAFEGVKGVVSVQIPDSVTDIYGLAFGYCSNLTSIIIPNSVKTLGIRTFDRCYGMSEIKFMSSVPPTVGTNCFRDLPTNCKIYVPTGSLSAYTSEANMPDPNTYTYVEY